MSGGSSNRASYTEHNEVQLIRGGKDYFDKVLEMIDTAVSSIHLQTYIYDEDETGNKIADALIRAVNRKVKVYVLLDGYASRSLSSAFIKKLLNAGIHFEYFMPLFRFKSFYLGRRLHYKVIVTDGYKCIVGGVNISNRYNDIMGKPAWLDWAIYNEGEASEELYTYCIEMWNKASKNKIYLSAKDTEIVNRTNNICHVGVRRNDWVNRRTQVSKSYKNMFATAQSHVIVMSSYFWPSRKILREMTQASKRGVKIQLILAGISDVTIAKYAERYMYRLLFRNKIEIYEYQLNVLHGKIAVKDSNLVTVGSYNVNNISAYASIEINLDIKNDAFANQVEKTLEHILTTDCVQIKESEFMKQNKFIQFLQMLSYEAIHFIFFLFTFYFKQTKYQH